MRSAEGRTGKKRIKAVVAGLSVCQGLQYTVSPVLDRISAHFEEIDVSLVQMLVTSPALLSMIVALIAGRLVVRITKKQLLVFGTFICGVTGFIPLLADNFPLLFLSRTIFGIGLGITTALNTVVVADYFEGEERVAVMGLQGASVGTGMLFITTISGWLGSTNFTNTYIMHLIAFGCMLLVMLFLPESEKITKTEEAHIQISRGVWEITAAGVLEFIFLISFTTNIAMHVRNHFSGSPMLAGMLTGIFSVTIIISGLLLKYVYRLAGKYTLSLGIFSFAAGAFVLVLFPSSQIGLAAGAVFCGISQGIFVPQAMCETASAANPISRTMAAALFTCGICGGQLISPLVLNYISEFIFGSVTTDYVFMTGAVCMLFIAALTAVRRKVETKI